MSYQLLTEYIAECGCTPDNDLCWKPFGARPVGSTGPFTFPFTVEINGEEVTFTNPGQILPGGSNPNITAWTSGPLEYAFVYSSACPTAAGCSDSALFLVEVDACCDGSVTISELDCEFTSSISGITTPSYQWQILTAGIWTNIPGETGTTYSGSDGEFIRLIVTDAFDGCIYISNDELASCFTPDPCAISCNLVWNEALGRLELTYNITGGPPGALYDIQFNEYSSPNPSNCALSSGIGIPQCTSSVPAGVGTVFCPQDPSTEDRCFRAVIFAEGGACICVDNVLVPASAGSCEVTIAQSLDSCTSTIDGPFPSGGGPSYGATLAPFQDNTVWQELDWYRELDLCGAGTALEIQEQSFSSSGANQSPGASYRVAHGWDLRGSDAGANGVDGDYVSSIQLSNNLGGTVTAVIDPANLNPNYANGPGGSVNPDHLYSLNVSSANAGAQEAQLIAAYDALLENIIDHEFSATRKSSATDSSPGDYYMEIDANQNINNNARWLNITFLTKHNAVGLWVGGSLGQTAVVSNANGDSNSRNIGDDALTGFGANNIIVSADTPCGNIFGRRYTIVPQDDALDASASDYNTIVASSADTDTDLVTGGTNSPLSCTTTVLTANVTGSGGNPSYVWSTGETTQSISVTDPGTYEVTVILDDGCQATASITI